MGFDTFNVGPELEYFLFEDDRGTETLDEGGYFAMTAQDAATEVRNDTIHALESVGIQIEYHHHEVAPSQHEIDMRYDDALAMADKTLTYRLVVKEVAAWHGYYATFMPKPLFGENGSGMHTHMSLFKGGRNQFFDAKDEHHLSATAKAFIAGVLAHAREMSAVLAQWVNSYKRLVPGYEAPVYVAWSQRNRSALIRIPLYKPGSEQATRAEIRCPDPGLQPVPRLRRPAARRTRGRSRRSYKLPDEMTTNLYRLSEDERRERGIVALPGSLGEAVEELAELRADEEGARRAHLPALRGAEAARVERVSRPGDRVGEGEVPGRPLDRGGNHGFPHEPPYLSGWMCVNGRLARVVLRAGPALPWCSTWGRRHDG